MLLRVKLFTASVRKQKEDKEEDNEDNDVDNDEDNHEEACEEDSCAVAKARLRKTCKDYQRLVFFQPTRLSSNC